MSNTPLTLLAIIVSLLCLLYLRNTDPKRYNAHRLPVPQHIRHTALGWLLCITPGILLLILKHYTPFILWFSGMTVIGWLVALPKPK